MNVGVPSPDCHVETLQRELYASLCLLTSRMHTLLAIGRTKKLGDRRLLCSTWCKRPAGIIAYTMGQIIHCIFCSSSYL